MSESLINKLQKEIELNNKRIIKIKERNKKSIIFMIALGVGQLAISIGIGFLINRPILFPILTSCVTFFAESKIADAVKMNKWQIEGYQNKNTQNQIAIDAFKQELEQAKNIELAPKKTYTYSSNYKIPQFENNKEKLKNVIQAYNDMYDIPDNKQKETQNHKR